MTDAKQAYEGMPAYEVGYNKGYDDAIEDITHLSYWEWNPNCIDWGLGSWQCHECNGANSGLPRDKNIYPLNWACSRYCPNCGRKMVSKEYYEGKM